MLTVGSLETSGTEEEEEGPAVGWPVGSTCLSFSPKSLQMWHTGLRAMRRCQLYSDASSQVENTFSYLGGVSRPTRHWTHMKESNKRVLRAAY